jgi:hypothetical protein
MEVQIVKLRSFTKSNFAVNTKLSNSSVTLPKNKGFTILTPKVRNENTPIPTYHAVTFFYYLCPIYF